MAPYNPSDGLADINFYLDKNPMIIVEFDTEENANRAFNIISTWEGTKMFIQGGNNPIYMIRALISSRSQYEIRPFMGEMKLREIKKHIKEGEPFVMALMSHENKQGIDKFINVLGYHVT